MAALESGPKSKTVRRVALASAMLLFALLAYLRFAPGRPAEASTPVPDYTPSVTALLVHAPNDAFEVVLRPASTPPKVVAYAFGIGDRDPNPIEASITFKDGTIRIAGTTRALTGAREARIVIGTAGPDSIRRFDDALSRARTGESDPAIRVLTLAITRE